MVKGPSAGQLVATHGLIHVGQAGVELLLDEFELGVVDGLGFVLVGEEAADLAPRNLGHVEALDAGGARGPQRLAARLERALKQLARISGTIASHHRFVGVALRHRRLHGVVLLSGFLLGFVDFLDLLGILQGVV